MKIEQLYDKEISRRINPAVVVSEMEDYFIKQEIDEYVFTSGITKHIYYFLNAIANKKEGKTGVWISGYYGSGKSHFIKYLFYCLDSRFRTRALANLKEAAGELDSLDEPTPAQVASLNKQLGKLQVEEIMFNIDAVSDQDNEKYRITRVLLNQLNAFRGYNNTNIALALYLEKPLDKSGNLEAFKQRIQAEFSEKWKGNQLRFARMYLDKVIDIAREFDSDIDKEALKISIQDRSQDYSIEFLINELKEFVGDKDDSYRMVFLIDKVSQYIGSNTALLLNLQTIVEEIGSQIGNKVWVVCTAQQDLSNLIKNIDSRTEDFGKIMARFETMIDLDSQDAALITKRRVLEKKSEGVGVLTDFYKDNKGAIENQFVFDHDLYENFEGRDDFTLTYPFIPYQFRLISDVFESFSNVGYVGEGVKNTERSILGITHYTANLCKDQEMGYFVPFDLFFNEQLEKHLSHRARGMLDRAHNLKEVKGNEFANRVVHTLFMISNLGDSQKVNFPANLESISLLLMTSADTPKLEMQTEVQKVLDLLVQKNIVQFSEGKYRFLKEDEIEVAELIKSTAITTEDRLDYIYNDIILKVVKPNPVLNFGNRNFRIAVQVDEKEIGSRGDFNLRFSIYDSTPLENVSHSTPSNDMVVGISEWLQHDKDMKAKILEYVRTQKYIRINSSQSTGTRTETLGNFRETNKLLLDEIKRRFEQRFLQTPLVSKNQVVNPEELTGSTPPARFEAMVQKHMEEVYRKNSLSHGYATTKDELLRNASSRQSEMHKDLSPAEEEVNNKINLQDQGLVVGDLVKQFERDPYGWKDISTIDVLLRLIKKGVRRVEWRNEEIELKAFVEKAVNSRERDAISIYKEKEHDQEQINDFIHAVNHDIFNESMIPKGTSDFKEVMETFHKKLEPKLTRLNSLKEDYESYPFASHLKSFHKTLVELHQERNQDKVLERVLNEKQQLKQARDTFMQIEEFLDHNFKAYQRIVDFADQNKANFDTLDETLQVRGEDLLDYLKNDSEPWEKFPQNKKAYKELNDAIKQRVSSLKAEVVEAYEKIFEEIENRRKELGIEASNLTTEASFYLERINKEKSISKLEVYKLEQGGFRSDNFKKLEDYKAQQEAKAKGQKYVQSLDVSLAAEMKPTTIENAEQLEAYLEELRKRLMTKLAKNQKLFLN